jgi:sulfide:quinone oxidoreductase
MANVVILGAGFGGLTVAHALVPALARGHSITLIDRAERFSMGLGKLWILIGERAPEAGWGEIARVRDKGIRFVRAAVTGIDLGARTVQTDAGAHPYDHLVVALGAELAPDAVPGFPPDANLYDRAQVPGLRDRLRQVSQGTVAIVVCAAPYKCPPAPFEAAMLVDAYLRRRGVRDAVRLEVAIPDPEPMPVAGPVAARQVRAVLGERGIVLRSSAKPASVDVEVREVLFEGGQQLPYDLLLAVPPHRAPRVVREAGLTDGSGWIPVDSGTLATSHGQVWAVGDVCAVKLPGGGMLPKAGILAEREGEVVGRNLLAALEGRRAEASFDGSGYCFFEVGDHRAMLVEGTFYTEPAKRVRFSEPSTESYGLKERFESERLARWFG